MHVRDGRALSLLRLLARRSRGPHSAHSVSWVRSCPQAYVTAYFTEVRLFTDYTAPRGDDGATTTGRRARNESPRYPGTHIRASRIMLTCV
eukprot:5306192-Prymnesium_polylepis.1